VLPRAAKMQAQRPPPAFTSLACRHFPFAIFHATPLPDGSLRQLIRRRRHDTIFADAFMMIYAGLFAHSFTPD